MALLPEVKEIGGVTYVRVTGPLSYLRKQGYPIDWMPYNTARSMALAAQGISKYDVYVYPRSGDIDGNLASLFKLQRAMGKVVIWETDDDYTNEYRVVIEADAIGAANEATALTVSTPFLHEQMGKYVDRPIYLLQNTIDFGFWSLAPKQRKVKGLSVGIVGTPSHYDDWSLVVDALHRIGREYPQVNFVIGGLFPDYLQDLPNLHHLKPVPYERYPQMVHQVDIGLCPLRVDDKFNWSKSAIKAMEYWTAGASVVMSDHPVYQRVFDPERGFLASTTDEWYTAIKAYIENPALRQAHAANGRKWVEKNRSMERNAVLWWAVYESAWNKYGGTIDEHFLSQWSVGPRPSDRKRNSGLDVLSLPRAKSRRRRRRAK